MGDWGNDRGERLGERPNWGRMEKDWGTKPTAEKLNQSLHESHRTNGLASTSVNS